MRRSPQRYHFLTRWPVEASPAAAYAALYEVVEYPRWWPEVKEARKIDEDHLRLRTRALLPYDLAFTLIRQLADPRRGILEARLEGDLAGTIRWSIVPTDGGSLITFDERVITQKELLDRLAPIARPAFIANHALMMRHGHAGLRAFLAGYELGRAQAASGT
ncbi:MAG: SRPBCC family protein [Candidatus Limnocylindria bacterium]